MSGADRALDTRLNPGPERRTSRVRKSSKPSDTGLVPESNGKEGKGHREVIFATGKGKPLKARSPGAPPG
jgi:hypothetical protein